MGWDNGSSSDCEAVEDSLRRWRRRERKTEGKRNMAKGKGIIRCRGRRHCHSHSGREIKEGKQKYGFYLLFEQLAKQ